MCQSEIAPGTSIPEAVAIVRHNIYTAREQATALMLLTQEDSLARENAKTVEHWIMGAKVSIDAMFKTAIQPSLNNP